MTIKQMDITPIKDFVARATKNFDDPSHGLEHAMAVYENAIKISSGYDGIDSDIIMYASLLHDVLDHKYVDVATITRDDLINFIVSGIGKEKAKVVMDIIDNVSFSKEVKGQRAFMRNSVYLDIVSDADRLEALGEVGIIRCMVYNKKTYTGHALMKAVIKHCHEKLLRLLPDGFIKTPMGKKMAEPLHREIVEFVEKNSV